MRPSTLYTLAWCLSMSLVIVPWWGILLYGLSRAQGGGESGVGLILFMIALVVVPITIAVLLWRRRRLGWILSMACAALLVIFFGGWFVSMSEHSLGSTLLMGTPLMAAIGVIALGWNRATKEEFTSSASPKTPR